MLLGNIWAEYGLIDPSNWQKIGSEQAKYASAESLSGDKSELIRGKRRLIGLERKTKPALPWENG